MKRTPLRRNTELKRGKPLAKRSKKMTTLYRTERVPLVKEMLGENPFCEMAKAIKSVHPSYNDCWRVAIGLHEKKKRSAGGSIIDRDNCVRTCGPCNSFVEDYPLKARQAGLTISAKAVNDPEEIN